MKTLLELEVKGKTVIFRKALIDTDDAGDGTVVTGDTIAAGSAHGSCQELKKHIDEEIERAATKAPEE